MYRLWAFWRRIEYFIGGAVIFLAVSIFLYAQFLYTPPTCFDGRQNGSERGVDCGGTCSRICAFDVSEPVVRWTQSFRVTDGQYNAVAYIENRNQTIGTTELPYTFSLYNEAGALITERTGTTFLPPGSVYPIFEGRIDVGTEIPARTFIEFEPVDDWRVVPVGREQFEVRSRTLTSADSKPRLDAAIFNTSLETARNVEIVATIFDARGNALTASQSVVPTMRGRTTENVVFTWPEPIAKTVRSCEVPSDVILAIDLSGSMNDDGGIPPEPISSVLTAAESFVGRLRDGDRVGVVTYATTAERVRALGADHAAAQETIAGLRISPASETGSTNIGDAIKRAYEEFNSVRHSVHARKVLVLLTDGIANAPGETAEDYARDAARIAREDDVTIFTIGLGSNLNEAFLGELASNDGQRFLAASTSALDRIYQSISTALCEEGAAVIDIVPKTPPVFGETL